MIVIIRPSILSEVRGIDILAGRRKGRLVELIFTVTHHSQKDRKLSISLQVKFGMIQQLFFSI